MIRGNLPALRIVVFAAGYSTRLGSPKALARIHGTKLLHRTVRVLAPFAFPAPVFVVVPPRSSSWQTGIGPGRVQFIVNPRRAGGLSTSVCSGIRRARAGAAVLLLPVDLMELVPRDIARLIARWRGVRRKVVARAAGKHAGAPLILPRYLFQTTLALTGDVGLRDLVRLLPAEAVRLVNLPSANLDVDTRQDLQRARRRFHARAF